VLDGQEFYPAQNFYNNQREAVATPAIQYTVLGDFYTVFIQADETDQSAVIKFISSPLVSWIWVGGLILVLGTALTLIPSVVAESRVKVPVGATASD
jgi:cytochrome c-type biogenesis protein CcmF